VAGDPYTIEEAADHIGLLRGQMTTLAEYISTGTLIVTGTITATGGTPGTPTLIRTDAWQSLGTLAGYTVVIGRYRLTTDNCVELDIKVTGSGTQATTVTFANTLPAAYQPATQHDSLPMGTTRAVTAGDISPRLLVSTAGAVTVNASALAVTFAICVRVPLD
jgi:hypothetical protein